MAMNDVAVTYHLGCPCCGQTHATALTELACTVCGHPLHATKPYSLQRTWAYLLAAAVLYVPANLLPVMHTTSAFKASEHTLIGGIVELWHDGAFALAVVVFLASIAVPMLKIGALCLLAYSAQFKPAWRRLERTRVFDLIETVGHWSMLDVYVVLLLAGMVQFGNLASAQAGAGLLAFAAVVVLTMLATHSFDPRMIWRDTSSS
jgi:paraquat-inducible protein A